MKEKLMYGKGFYDLELPRSHKVDGKFIPKEASFTRWERMLHRCYGESTKKDRPTYNGCEVCEEWLVFSNFKKWIEPWENWQTKQLDKDLLVEGNKIYSPDSCCMVENRINSFLTLRQNHRGFLPLGVTRASEKNKHVKKFVARINVTTGVRESLGYYHTPEEAHRAWQLAKRDRALQLQAEQTDSRVIGGLQRIIDKLQYDYDNNLETKTL